MLKVISDYGHGVFTLTMAGDKKSQNNLRMWLVRNPEMSTSYRGVQGDIGVYALTKKGMTYFKGKDSLSKAKNYFSFLELAIVNAYMIEIDSFTNYLIKPNLSATIKGKSVGLLSPKWGWPKDFINYDLLLTIPETKANFMSKLSLIKSEQLRALIEDSYIPRALRYLGNRSRNNG